ncbi:MAG: hypothetical protein JNL32_16365, partial [Candidatus Kapabacteria bacterium]|nr:hypothetical protein [Candidatus Kapabacteria bacterium]
MYSILDYYDEMMMRLRRYYVSQELDAGTAEMIINRARRDVQMAILPIYRERFTCWLNMNQVVGNTVVEETTRRRTMTRFGGTQTTNRSYVMQLPADFIEADVVIVEGSLGSYEASELSKREFYSIMGQSWAYPSPHTPKFCVEKDTEQPNYVIRVSKGPEAVTLPQVRVYYVRAV